MDTAFEKARAAYGTGAYDDATLEFLFPELKESEDERIRKGMIRFLNSEKAEGIFTYEARQSWIAYLKRQKPAEWSEEDENAIKYLHELICFGVTEKFFDGQTAADMRIWINTRLKSPRPQPHWKPSEEQMAALYTAAREAPIIKENGNYLYDLYADLQKLL